MVDSQPAAEPRCVVHGPMRYRAAGHWWVCPGWDGELCCALAAELLPDLAAELLPGQHLAVTPAGMPSQWDYRAAIPAASS